MRICLLFYIEFCLVFSVLKLGWLVKRQLGSNPLAWDFYAPTEVYAPFLCVALSVAAMPR